MTNIDQKVREKLAHLIGNTRIGERVTTEVVLEGADAILQSTELRVTLYEPRFYTVEALRHIELETGTS